MLRRKLKAAQLKLSTMAARDPCHTPALVQPEMTAEDTPMLQHAAVQTEDLPTDVTTLQEQLLAARQHHTNFMIKVESMIAHKEEEFDQRLASDRKEFDQRMDALIQQLSVIAKEKDQVSALIARTTQKMR